MRAPTDTELLDEARRAIRRLHQELDEAKAGRDLAFEIRNETMQAIWRQRRELRDARASRDVAVLDGWARAIQALRNQREEYVHDSDDPAAADLDAIAAFLEAFDAEEILKEPFPGRWTVNDDLPIRQKSANGQPTPNTSIERVCARCRASFLGLAPGKTGERGIWRDWSWYCSEECNAARMRSDVILRESR